MATPKQLSARYILAKTSNGEDLYDILLAIAKNESRTATAKERLEAIKVLLDRSLGKPDQVVTLDDTRAPDPLDKLSLEELDALVGALSGDSLH